MEKDFADFKDINKLYTDQLVKVKVRIMSRRYIVQLTMQRFQMSDMANNDLEKYAKALDRCVYRTLYYYILFDVVCSAIMKYHSLKMQEVNDTMRHLWLKTYQGTGELGNTSVANTNSSFSRH